MLKRLVAAFLVTAATPAAAPAQLLPPHFTKAEPATKADTIPPARDIAFPGTIRLEVDATDITRRIFNIRQHIPVPRAGDFVLLYPQWLPGSHSPGGRINKVAGFKASAGGRILKWKRDPLDVFAFHVDVPEGVSAIDVSFQFLSPTAEDQGRVVMTPDMASIQWISTSLYPAGYYTRDIPVQATLKVPAGWRVATALRPEKGGDTDTITYRPTSYEILADSPALAGRNFRKIELSPDVTLNVVGDTAKDISASDELIGLHRNLVDQALKLFGAQHYDHYDFLFSISDSLGGSGLEHHRSSEDGVKTGYFTDFKSAQRDRNLLPHEYVHSWDGKYRRGKDLWTPDFRTRMEGSLLWVYEGQTQFWGYVLDARSGLLSKQETLDAIADTAATYDNLPGRDWRPLVDTTNDPIIAQRSPQPWRSWQRSEDYYSEGQLIWIDVDRIIRQRSNGRKSIDDFARAFFGINDRDYGELTYTFEDVVATLNRVQPYDWAGYLRRRVYEVNDKAPLEGIEQGGYKLVYTDTPTGWFKDGEKKRKVVDLSYSGGFSVALKDGKIGSVQWGSKAFDAGLIVGATLVAVDGHAFDPDHLKEAIRAASGSGRPVSLLLRDGDIYRTADLDWHGGLRYPRLEPTAGGRGTLDALLAPLK